MDNKTFLTFKLKTHCDANIALCAIYGSVEHKAHEIAIGADDNTKSYIRDGSLGAVKSEAQTVNILSENGKVLNILWPLHNCTVVST